MELGFDLEVALKELDDAEPDEEGEASVFVGTVFSLTPSGKYYMPWASSNVQGCDGCNGTGTVRFSVSPRVAKKWKNQQQIRRLWIKRYGVPSAWPERIRRRSDRLNQLLARASNVCLNCGGLGSAEAYRDERWQEFVEEELQRFGCYLRAGEGNGTDLYLCTYKEIKEQEDGGT